MTEIVTAEYRRWYGLDKPWTGGPDIAFHLGQVLDALDAARGELADYCRMNDAAHRRMEGAEAESERRFAGIHEATLRAETAETRISNALNRNNYCECGNSASIYSALTDLS